MADYFIDWSIDFYSLYHILKPTTIYNELKIHSES